VGVGVGVGVGDVRPEPPPPHAVNTAANKSAAGAVAPFPRPENVDSPALITTHS
jgi:hypothetical protein